MGFITKDQTLTQRAKEVENAVASVWLEGLEPSDEAKAIFQRYIDGELTSEELDRTLELSFDRQ